jgi:hypothetical protein
MPSVQVGLVKETDPTIPITQVKDVGPGMFGPNYSFADNLPLPGQVGVRDGDNLTDVVDSVKAVAYYVDMIGFGEASTGLSRSLNPKPLGVNTWMETPQVCSNGANMWVYMEGIPTGNALGKRVKDGLASAGLPGMRGLAPGMLEDAESALDPRPVLSSAFGSGLPRCRLVEKEVGDQDGSIQNSATNEYYIFDKDSAVKRGGRYYQKRWAFDSALSKKDWDKEKKTHCPNGYLKKNHLAGDCSKKLLSREQVGGTPLTTGGKEGFANEGGSWINVGLLTAIILGTLVLIRRR